MARGRVQRVASHLTAEAEADEGGLTALLLGAREAVHREAVFRAVRDDVLFKYDYNATKEAQRQVAVARVKRLIALGFVNPYDESDFERTQQCADAVNLIDHSVNTLIGAQLVLFAGSIRKLGTEVHHERYLKRAEAMELSGCFAMTELGHGSNVRGLETTATFDPAADEFVIHTPTETAQKYWIGNGVDAHMATVFAQLIVKGVHYGVHAILVPLRDPQTHRILPGITVRDCGLKQGINGVANARLWFDHVRVPRENLLNRFGSVARDGSYESLIADNDMRFAATIANLLVGRVGLISGANGAARIALATAVRYAHTRRQFGPPNGPETPIIDYTTTQLRLLPTLATTYAHHFIIQRVSREFYVAQRDMDMDGIKNIHLLLSGLKALCSWHCAETLSLAREACGGQGYKASNRIGFMMGETDVMKTYEGDNMVLLQGLARDLVRRKYPDAAALRGDLELRTSTDDALLRGSDHQLRLFRLREADLVTRLAAALDAAGKAGATVADAMQTYALLAVDAARAHTERLVFEHMVAVENAQAEPRVRGPLARLRSLYAVYRLDRDPSFLRGQYLSPAKADAVSRLLVALLGEVKRVALPLVNAFAIPDFLLGEIAGDWVAANARDVEWD